MAEQPPLRRPQLAPEPADPPHTYVDRWLKFHFEKPWAAVMLTLAGVAASTFFSGKYVAGGILTFLTIALSLLVPLRWGLSRAQFHPRVEWLLPGAVCGISVAVTGAKAGVGWGALMFGTAVLSMLAGQQIGRYESEHPTPTQGKPSAEK